MNRAQAESFFFEGVACMDSDPALAQACFRRALDCAPDLMQAHANLGLLLEAQGAWDEAAASYQRAIALNPDQPEPHMNLGGLLARRKRFEEAEIAYSQALRLNPESPGVWSNFGALYAAMRLDSEAEGCYRHALTLDPAHAKARFNLACLLLRQGRLEEGWQALEARDWYRGLADRLPMPRWQGESLVGKSVLMGFEAGHGDMIHMVRYAAVLKARGAARITLLCHPALKRLFAALEAVDQVLGFDEPLPVDSGHPGAPWDVWTPPFSIPFHCQTRLDSIPAQLPYLHAPALECAKWAQQLSAKGVRVGVVWRGSPQFENDADRSLPSLDVLAPLGAVPGVCWVSLQKGAEEDEALHPPGNMSLLPLGAQAQDFADMAALVSCLDLVISVDTAVAHLAGALGKPVWLLLPHYMTDWRWLDDRTDSPWYPGVMRLFRQSSAAGSWVSVVDTVREELALLLGDPSSQKGLRP
jgi:tetratricopeptide (TPR) repeat protein